MFVRSPSRAAALVTAVVSLCVTGCARVPGAERGGDEEGALRDQSSSRYDLTAYAFVTGLVGVNEEASELYDTLASSGKTNGKAAYAGLTGRELGLDDGQSGDGGNVVGVTCTPAEGGGEYSFASCTIVAVVATADVKPIKDGAITVTIRGPVAEAIQKHIPASGLGTLKCTAGGGRDGAACTGAVLGAAPTFDTLVNESDMLVSEADKIIGATFPSR